MDRGCRIGDLTAVVTLRVNADQTGYRELRRFAARWPRVRWAVESAVGLGGPLTERLRADDVEVVDVPAKLARQVRLPSTGRGRKSDPADALSIGVAAQSVTVLNTVEVDEAIAGLRALTEHRDDLVRTRTQAVNRLHTLLVRLVPSGLGRGLTAEAVAQALRGVRPRTTVGPARESHPKGNANDAKLSPRPVPR